MDYSSSKMIPIKNHAFFFFTSAKAVKDTIKCAILSIRQTKSLLTCLQRPFYSAFNVPQHPTMLAMFQFVAQNISGR